MMVTVMIDGDLDGVPVGGHRLPDQLLPVQRLGVLGSGHTSPQHWPSSTDLRHQDGGGQGEHRVQGGHPLQRGAVRGAADSVPVMLILSFSASTSMLFKLIHISSISSSYI